MSTATGFVVVEDAVVDVTVLLGTVVVTVVVDESGVANVDGISVVCPAVEQATISSRDPTFSRIATP